jgi:hypothetical protein
MELLVKSVGLELNQPMRTINITQAMAKPTMTHFIMNNSVSRRWVMKSSELMGAYCIARTLESGETGQ